MERLERTEIAQADFDERMASHLRALDIKIEIKHREWQEALAEREMIVAEILGPMIIQSYLENG